MKSAITALIMLMASFSVSAANANSCGYLTIATGNTKPAALLANIDGFILEHGFNCDVVLLPSKSELENKRFGSLETDDIGHGISATTHTITTDDFAKKYPCAYSYVSNRFISDQHLTYLLDWIKKNRANNREAAIHFIENFPNVWKNWLNETGTKVERLEDAVKASYVKGSWQF